MRSLVHLVGLPSLEPHPLLDPDPVSVQCCLLPRDLQLSALGKLNAIIPDQTSTASHLNRVASSF